MKYYTVHSSLQWWFAEDEEGPSEPLTEARSKIVRRSSSGGEAKEKMICGLISVIFSSISTFTFHSFVGHKLTRRWGEGKEEDVVEETHPLKK